ncbi:helix-turn-helix transcriptional regulator [Nocardia vinacea]|uniref:helix-turn-helix transcriptional regulator n=1 Tax=Nocardia vinacea TaxID=96468 RepID=UPI0003181036|nr:helix-turn-helix transcriptional regulator [Nocardia vinacea]
MDELQVPTLAEFVRMRRQRPTAAHPGGLSRQQLAEAIHSSVGYLAKIEQGGAFNPSPSILDALADVFALDPDERIHLYHLAQQRFSGGPRRPGPVRPPVRKTLDALTPHLAAALDDGWRVIDCNDAFDEAFPGLRPNGHALRWMFTDPRARLVIEEWEREADLMVGRLRAYAARATDRDDVQRLLRDLGGHPDFHRLWMAGRVYIGRRDPTIRLRNRKTGKPFEIHVQRFRTTLPEPMRQLFVGLVDDRAAA